MKSKFFLVILLVVLTFEACSSGGRTKLINQTENIEATEVVIEDAIVEIKKEEIIPVSEEYEEIKYQGNLNICKVLNVGYDIFLIECDKNTKNYEVHKMKIGDNSSEKMPVNIPEDMETLHFTMDVEGNLHLFLKNKDKSSLKCEIWVVNQEGEKIRTLDVTNALPENEQGYWFLYGFAIDKEGRYYLSKSRNVDRTNAGLLILDSDGKLLGIVEDKNYHLWENENLVRGNDGNVYVLETYLDAEQMYIGDISLILIDPEKICLDTIYKDILPSNTGVVYGVSTGAGTRFLMIKSDGIFTYDLGEEKGNKVLREADIPFSIKETDECNAFLDDGRLLMITGDFEYEEITYENGIFVSNLGLNNAVFHYVPIAYE